jgi:hypothetical protein
MDIPSYKLHVKLGEAEFNAEGPQEIVQKAFEKFLTCTDKISTSTPIKKPSGPPEGAHQQDGQNTGQLDSALLSRAFMVDAQKGIVSLRALPPDGPNKASDAALMILYGAHLFLHKTEFPVTRLKKGLQKSGIQVGRIDRIMEPYKHSVIKGGSGVGGRYSLNNQGTTQVEGLLKKIFS